MAQQFFLINKGCSWDETKLEMNVFMNKIFISHIFKICKYEYLNVIQCKQPT